METDGEQNQQGASTNGSPSSGTSSRPSAMNSMSLYERQAVQVGGISVCLCVLAHCLHCENISYGMTGGCEESWCLCICVCA